NQKPGPKDWIRAGSLKGKVILEDQRHKRMCFKLWIKIKPHPSDSACEYKNKGKVRVKALEQKCWVTDC
ncbi:hypothetical protein KJA17_00650, partial [Patescibacteria group bacterium]|nr:hypothetical protein [Patescibacteria group bacterium]